MAGLPKRIPREVGMVTKEDFEAYEGVRRSGMVNMFDPMARELAGLDKKTFINIMKDYDYLKQKFE